MIAAGLLARNAVERGLDVPAYVKTSLAPGSRVVTEYLEASGLLPYLEDLGYNVVGYGCTTCIGNAGPLPEPIERAIDAEDLWTTSVLSGNQTSRLASTRRFVRTTSPARRSSSPMASPGGWTSTSNTTRSERMPTAIRSISRTSGPTPTRSTRRFTTVSIPRCSKRSTPPCSRETNAGRHSMRRPVRSTSGTTLRRTSASRPSSRTSRWKSPVSQISTTPAR